MLSIFCLDSKYNTIALHEDYHTKCQYKVALTG